jgi:hypothetical protein
VLPYSPRLIGATILPPDRTTQISLKSQENFNYATPAAEFLGQINALPQPI